MSRKFIVLLTVIVVGQYSLPSKAEEPVDAFLDALQQRGHYDVATQYIDRLSKSSLAPAGFADEADYRKGMLAVRAARATKNRRLRQNYLSRAQEALDRFLADQPQHSSAALARSHVANILVERARGIVIDAEKSPVDRAALLARARKVYEDAEGSLRKSRTEIAEQYKQLVSKRDPDSRAQLPEVKSQYVQTYLAIARVLFEHAETLADVDEEEYKAKLTEAATAFDEVAQKYRGYSAGVYALFFEGQCYQLLGEDQRALTYFKELLQNPDDSLGVRRLKTQALSKSIASWLKTERNRGPDRSISMANAWLKKVRGNEDRDPAWLELRLALAKAYHQKSTTAQEDIVASRARREAKEIISELARRQSSVQKEAQELLVAWGGSEPNGSPTAAPTDSKDFAEAYALAKKSLDAMKLTTATINILSAQLVNIQDPQRRSDIETKLEEARQQSATSATRALELFERADQLGGEGNLDELNGVRYYLSYLYYQKQEFLRAAVIASFVSIHFPDSLAAKECAAVALAARQRLYQSASEEERLIQGREIGKVARMIVSQWPDQPQAATAMLTLLDITLAAGNVEEAEALLAKMPEEAERRADAELRIGQALWREYLTSSRDGTPTPPSNLSELRNRARRMLAGGIGRISASDVSEVAIRAALSLAQIYVESGEPVEAIDLLNRRGFGAVTLAKSNSPWLQRIPILATEAYKTAIRAHVAAAAAGDDPRESITAAQEHLVELRDLLGDSDTTRLTAIYVSLARDLERQLANAPPENRKVLSKAFESFLRNAAAGSKDLSIQNWVGATFFSLGQSMMDGTNTTPEAQRYYNEASSAYQQVLAMAKSQPGDLSPTAILQIQTRLAIVLRQLGKYEDSISMFADILGRQKRSYLNIQVEAAKTFQQWGASGNAEAFQKAIQGDVRGRDGTNTIWGWGRIAKLVSQNEKFRDTFHEARYNIPAARYQMALTNKGPQQQELLARAKTDILMTKRLYNLGTKRQQQRYENLLRKIQKSLGEEATGFAE